MERYTLHHGDCLDVLPGLPMADSIVTDPPAGIGFMGAEWDKDKGGRDAWVAWLGARLRAARERLRPGGYALVWALPRTSHWTALAIEDAGFVIQDRVSHIFGSGFPKHKSHLKPAVEDWWLAYNPGGARALQVEACRVGYEAEDPRLGWLDKYAGRNYEEIRNQVYGERISQTGGTPAGRWPPHLLLTHSADCDEAACVEGCPVRLLGEQSGETGNGYRKNPSFADSSDSVTGWNHGLRGERGHNDTGTAARFFPQFRYVAKASRRERGEGNTHPTVKPLALCQWLVRLVTPKGGLVLDPFMGSGSVGCAAILEGCGFVGIEASAEYLEIARARIAHYADPLRHMEAA